MIPSGAINAALDLLPRRMDTATARVMLAAIGLQESRFVHRYQVVSGSRAKGPARGFWQFEQGGVAGVMRHEASGHWMRAICAERGVPTLTVDVWRRLEVDDVLAAATARLLLWTDPAPLPTDEQQAWQYYLRCWRPGKPHPQTWSDCWDKAVAAVDGD